MQRCTPIGVAFALLGCHEDSVPVEMPPPPELLPKARLAEYCGQREPVRLLALNEDEHVSWGNWAPAPWRDLFLFTTTRCASSDECSHTDGTTLTLTGRCGEDPVSLHVPNLQEVKYPADEFSELIGCTRDREIVVLDPEAALVRPVLGDTTCYRAAPLEEGLVALRGSDEGPLSLWFVASLSDANAKPTPLNIEIARLDPDAHTDTAMRTANGTVFVLDARGRLMAIDPYTRTEEQLAEQVGAFDVSADGRFVSYAELEPFVEGIDNHPKWLLDRQTGARIEAGWGNRRWRTLRDGFTIAHADPALGGMRVVLVPELETLTFPERSVQTRLEDGRLLLWDGAAQLLLDPADGSELFVASSGLNFMQTPWGLELWSHGGLDGPNFAYRLYHTELDGEPPTEFPRLVRGAMRVSPDVHIATICPDVLDEDLGIEQCSGLVVLDRRYDEPRRLATDAFVEYVQFPPPATTSEGIVTFERRVDGRRGVWAAKLP